MKKIFSVAVVLSVLLSLLAIPAKAAMPSGWGYSQSGSGYDFEIAHEKSVAYNGRASLHIMFDAPYTANHYLQITGPGSLEEGKTYLFEFWFLGEAQWKWSWDWTTLDYTPQNIAEDWTKYSFTFTPNMTGGWLRNYVDSYCDYYIDDVAIYEIGEDGELVGENLCEYGDFESGDFTPPGAVSAVESESFDSAVALSWTNPKDGDFSHVEIYSVEEDGTETLVAEATPGIDADGAIEKRSSCTVENLENGKVYIFNVYAVDTGDNLSAPFQSFGKPVILPYYAGEIKAEFEGEVLAGADVTVSTTLINNTSEESICAYLVAAIYQNGSLTDMEIFPAEVSKGDPAKDFIIPVSIPETAENVELCCYFWDQNYQPLSEGLIVK